ncbi:pathogenesis-related protein PR-1 [Cannabis sativa]|nr:pathogenesis-related protein PR-1 [Cannabis sativa]
MAKPHLFFILFTSLLLIIITNNSIAQQTQITNKKQQYPTKAPVMPNNETIYRVSKQLCWGCVRESLEFLFEHNLARAKKWELPLAWDGQLQKYAQWWASQRRSDCKLQHSFPEGDFKLGENIFWGSGSDWTPSNAVDAWTDEEKYYNYEANSCAEGQMCGHYTQVVWRSTRRIGCARVVCDDGDVFITCNYDPVGNYVGERPY